MESSRKSHKIYHSHRENQRERILAAAEELFIRSGIDGVTLTEIAGGARLSRVTLYEYFSDKQEIAWAVFQKVVQDMRDAIGGQNNPAAGTGYEKLKAFLESRLQLFETYPDHLRFIAVFNFLYAREGGSARMRSILEQTLPGYYGLPAEWIRAGIADGSIRPVTDANLTSAAIFNLLAGLDSRFSMLESVLPGEYGYRVIDLYREICSNFLRSIQAG